jgi:hypothetical protein
VGNRGAAGRQIHERESEAGGTLRFYQLERRLPGSVARIISDWQARAIPAAGG